MNATSKRTWIGSAALVLACGGPRGGDAEPQGAATSPAPTADLTPSAPVPPPTGAPPSTAAPLRGRDHQSSVACTADVECGWDDSCFPQRCVEARAPSPCTESAPPPGTCSCVDGACTTKPKVPPSPAGPCERGGCVVDRAAGRCVADSGGIPEHLRSNPGVNTGPSCDCVEPDRGCTFRWFDPVPCKSERDCWVDHAPRAHPVPRPAHLRGRDFKPCSDGETGPVCRDGACALGPRYKC